VKVLDFGLVKVVNEEQTQLTVEGATTGTPAYMAPEVALGKSRVDARTDLYSLGCVAYWLLTGRLVFEEKGATAVMLAHVQKSPLPPSQISELSVPALLDRAVMQCLAKDPEAPPPDAEGLARKLEDNDQGDRWTGDEAHRWWLTHMPEVVAREVREEPQLNPTYISAAVTSDVPSDGSQFQPR